MAKDAKRGETAPHVASTGDEQLTKTRQSRYRNWRKDMWRPFYEALSETDAELREWLSTTCEKAARGSLDPPTAPPQPCVVDGEVVCSPYALLTFMSSTKVNAFFARELNLTSDDQERGEIEDERKERYFSARVLGQVFLSYRIVCAQMAHAKESDKGKLRRAWFHPSARAVCELVRPADFDTLSNLSFAVVCCVVDAGLEMELEWPASLMTAERMAAARRGLTRTENKKESVKMSSWEDMSCLPLVRACNRCAASQVKSQGRPRICTFIPRKIGEEYDIVSCLACAKADKGDECRLLYVKDSAGEEEVESEDSDDEGDEGDEASISSPNAGVPGAQASPRERMEEWLAKNKRAPSGTFEHSTPKKPKTIMEVVIETPRRRSSQVTPHSKGGAPEKDTPLKHTADAPARAPAPAAAVSSARVKPVASETPAAGSWANPSNNDPASEIQGRRPPAQVASPPAGNPAAAHTYPGSQERSQSGAYRISDDGPLKEGVFVPGSGYKTATLALNSASTSGVTVTVPLVEYESLVTFYEAMSNLDGMTGVSHAAVRGRKEIDTVRRALHDHDEAMRSIGLAREELRRLEDKIAARRREGDDEKSEPGEKEK